MTTGISDDVFDTVINAISPYGPIGIIVVLLIISIVIMAVSLRKSLKHWINMKADNQMAQKESILRRDEQDQAARQRRSLPRLMSPMIIGRRCPSLLTKWAHVLIPLMMTCAA